MRWAMPKPWMGPKVSRVLRTRRSSVPCKTSAFGGGICVPPDDQHEVRRIQIPRSPVGDQQEYAAPVERLQEPYVAQGDDRINTRRARVEVFATAAFEHSWVPIGSKPAIRYRAPSGLNWT